MVGFEPVEVVRDEDAAAVEEVFAAAGEGAAFGVGEEHVAAVVFYWKKVLVLVEVIPVDFADGSP